MKTAQEPLNSHKNSGIGLRFVENDARSGVYTCRADSFPKSLRYLKIYPRRLNSTVGRVRFSLFEVFSDKTWAC